MILYPYSNYASFILKAGGLVGWAADEGEDGQCEFSAEAGVGLQSDTISDYWGGNIEKTVEERLCKLEEMMEKWTKRMGR